MTLTPEQEQRMRRMHRKVTRQPGGAGHPIVGPECKVCWSTPCPLDALDAATARADAMLAAEHAMSDAYLRLRHILGAFDTPNAPTGEQVWQHTEQKARDLVARAAYRARGGNDAPQEAE